MANKQVNQLTELTSAIDADLVPVYDTQESGSEKLKKMTLDNFRSSLPITTDTTAYVATTGSDTTGDGSESSPFATINKAFDSLKDRPINPDAFVTIQVADGHYDDVDQIQARHPNGSNIWISGSTIEEKTLSSVQSVSGSSRDYTVVLNLNNVSNLDVGDIVIIGTDVSGGSFRQCLMGSWPITNVDSGNNRITIETKIAGSNQPSGAISGTIYIPKTVLKASLGTTLFYSKTNLINIKNLSLHYPHTTGSTSGVSVSNMGYVRLDAVGISGFHTGIRASNAGQVECYTDNYVVIGGGELAGDGILAEYNSSVEAQYVITNGFDKGIRSYYSASIRFNNGQAHGNSTVGVIAAFNGTVYADNALAISNVDGFRASEAGVIRALSSTSSYNSDNGYESYYGGSLYINNATSTNNGGYGIRATATGYVSAFSVSASSNSSGDYNPSPNTQGNEYGYINT
jgi:hypothetical protein